MKLAQISAWLDRELELSKFDDVSNNGLQIAREGDDVKVVAFAVDGSVASVKAAAAAGAQLLVVHHGISWGGGIRRLTDGAYNVVKAAMDANLALYGVHLPLDASKKYGNNWEIARFLKLTNVRPAFNYHGNVIGVIGTSIVFQSESSKSGLKKSVGRRAGSPTHLIFQSPFRDFLYGVTGSRSSVSAAVASASGTAYVAAGMRLMELTAGFSQSFNAFSSATTETPASTAAARIIVFCIFSIPLCKRY